MDKQLAELEFLCGQAETIDAFATVYERMLNECRLLNDSARRSRARKLQRIMCNQLVFVNRLMVAEVDAGGEVVGAVQ